MTPLTKSEQILLQFADPSDGKYFYPVNWRRTEWNVRDLRLAEASLDSFWFAIDVSLPRHFSCHCKTARHEAAAAVGPSSNRIIRRTPKWNDTLPSESSCQAWYDYQPFSGYLGVPTTPVTVAVDRTWSVEELTAMKMREAGAIPVVPAVRKPKFRVDGKTYNVVNVLFRPPNSPDLPTDGFHLPAEIEWLDFVHAMTVLGFEAEKQYGSAWNFVPSGAIVGIEESVKFDEPLHDSKIPFL